LGALIGRGKGVVVSCQARYDDTIRIETAFSLGGKLRLRFDYRLFHKDNGTLLAEGYTVHVCTDKDGRVIKPPPELRKLLKQMQEMPSDEHSKE